MSFKNLYYKRTVATAKACYVCYRPTTTVLATIDTIDFVYACPGHLSDPNFAAIVKDDADNRKLPVTAEEIAKVKEEWEEKQKKKAEKEKAKKDEADSKGKEDKEREDTGTEREDSNTKTSKIPGSLTSGTVPKPSHERYILHRDFFSMRQAEHRKRRQTTQAKALAPRLPGAPSGGI